MSECELFTMRNRLQRGRQNKADFTADLNQVYSEHFKKLKVDHELPVVPGVAHETMPLLKGLGEANWDFYRAAFGKK